MMPRRRILVVAPTLAPLGGGRHVAAWGIQALSQKHAVTLLCWEAPALEQLDRHFGTSLVDADLTIIKAAAPLRWLCKIDPDPFSFQPAAFLAARTRRLGSMFDVVMGFENEMDFGAPGIVYMHYPYLAEALNELNDDDVAGGIFSRWRSVLGGKIRPWVAISGTTRRGVLSNRLLVNSDWTGRVVSGSYDVSTTTLHPPVPWRTPSLPWNARDDAFVCIGRLAVYKRQLEAIEIVRRLRDRGHAVTLRIIGDADDPAYSRQVHEAARAAGPWVEIFSGISRQELEEKVARCRYGLHLMEDEHFGIAVAELGRSGCLPFIHDSGGQTEIITDPDLRFRDVDDAEKKIARVMDDPERAARLRETSMADAMRFSEQRFSDRLLEIIDEFVGDRA